MAKVSFLNKVGNRITPFFMSVLSNKDTSEFAAAACLKYTTEGDYNNVIIEEAKQ